MKKITYLIVFLFLYQISFSQCQLDTAVNFSVKDVHGTNIELFPILDEGKLVVIDFFSTSCGPCALYAPEVQASYEDFGENTGNVFFLNIAYGDNNNGVMYFDSIYGVTSPSVSGSQGGGNGVHSNFLIQSTPTVILIAPDRVILEQYIWEPTQANLNAAIMAAGGSMVGINDDLSDQDDELIIYPNPATNLIHVKVNVRETAVCQMEIYNMLGTKVHQSVPAQLPAGNHVLQSALGELPGGTYFIRLIKNGQQAGRSKLILLD